MAEGNPVLLSPAQRTELDRRLEDLQSHPEEETAWEDVREAVRSDLPSR